MWTKEMFGMDVYHLLLCFIAYSMLGWLVESIYMSFCNRKMTNRGFTKSPFCPIYGFGAMGAYILLKPFASNYIMLYFVGAILATLFEFLVARLMIRLFGEVWWDYKNKPMNYKGIVCLESTIAWGFYTVILFLFLHNFIMGILNKVPFRKGVIFMKLVIAIFVIDFTYHLVAALGINVREYMRRARERFNRLRRG